MREIIQNILIIIAFLIGYAIGNYQRSKDLTVKLKEKIKDLTANKEIKVFPKKEPKSQIAEINEELEKTPPLK